MDRALAAAVVALARQGIAEMTPPRGAAQIVQLRTELEAVAQRFADGAAEHYAEMSVTERQALHEFATQHWPWGSLYGRSLSLTTL